MALRRLHRVFSLLREVHPGMPVQIAQSFLIVAQNEGRSMTELAQLMGAKQSTMSRHLADLGERNRTGGEGFLLVQRNTSPTDIRHTSFTLTDKGRVLIEKLIRVVGGVD